LIFEEVTAMVTVGLLSPGDMGGATGRVLQAGGARVLTCLAGRSARTRSLAAAAGFADVPTLDDFVREADVILCILVPSQAHRVAESVAAAIRTTGADVTYADCNAVSPQTVRAIGETITAAGGRFVDAGIIGGPPTPGSTGTRYYVSGPYIESFVALAEHGLTIRDIGDEIGHASGLKMCYAALTKGLTALGTELLLAAKLLGLEDALRVEQTASTPDLLASLARSIPAMTPKAYRWVGEMEEIAATFAAIGLTPAMFAGAAEMYRLVAAAPIGHETPENRNRDRDMDGVIAALADAMHVMGNGNARE